MQGAGGNLFPTGINSAGQIAGYGGPFGTTRLFRYTPGLGFLDLGTFGGREHETTGVNNHGQVVGFSSTTDGRERAFRYTDGIGLQDLGTLPGGEHSEAHGINDGGWVTGTSGNRAFIWADGMGMVDIGPGSGWAINEAGVVAGEASFQPVLYLNGQVIPLGGIGSARGINNNNVVVGADLSSFERAFIWSQQEGMQDLNCYVDPQSGWYLAAATGINDAGQIVGWGYSPERGTLQTAFRLDPIPEPSTWALLALGGVGAALFNWQQQKRTLTATRAWKPTIHILTATLAAAAATVWSSST